MIEAKNLTKQFLVSSKAPGLCASIKNLFTRKKEVRNAVTDFSVNIGPGEIVGLVGPNGAGKTTIIKMLAGIIYPTSGTAYVQGYVPWEKHIHFRKQISIVMGQKAQLGWDLPSEDCFNLLKEIYQIPIKQFKENIENLTNLLNIKHLLNIPIRKLSLGERMKMELVASLLHQPKVIFLDEPTIGLDGNSQRSLREFILNYSKRTAPCIIITSHYMEDIEQLCNRVLLLNHGQVKYDGKLVDLVNKNKKCKLIKVRLNGKPCPNLEFIESIKRIDGVLHIDLQQDYLILRINHNETIPVIIEILHKYNIHDLNIQNEDLIDIINDVIKDSHNSKNKV